MTPDQMVQVVQAMMYLPPRSVDDRVNQRLLAEVVRLTEENRLLRHCLRRLWQRL